MSSLSPIWLIMLLPPLLLLEAFFSGSEIALLSADQLALKAAAKGGSWRARIALKLAGDPNQLLSVTLLMTSLCVILVSSLIALYFDGLAETQGLAHAELIAIACTSPLIVIFGELIPKTFFRQHADRIAGWVAVPLWATFWVMYPLTWLLNAYTSRLARAMEPIESLLTGRQRTRREELRTLLGYARRDTGVKSSEQQIIQRIFDFRDTEAKDALIPLVQMEAIEESATVRQAMERFMSHGHSRMPVYAGRIDNVIGVLELSDLYTAPGIAGAHTAPGSPGATSIRNYISPAHYVAETQGLKDVLLDMRREDIEISVVVDEYGGAVGIISFEDIVEEIVGEIRDEYDSESVPFKEIEPQKWIVQAKMAVQALNEELQLALPEGDYETLSGFLLQQFGRIPETGAELFFVTPAGSVHFTVRKATERRIESVMVHLTLPASQSEA